MLNPASTRLTVFVGAMILHSNVTLAAGNVLQNPHKNLYFGETHMHTAYSLDAFLGGTRQTPADAYRFAKGATVVVNGQPHKMRRPLDFAAVTDHAEYLGEMFAALNPGAPGHDIPQIQQLIGLTDFDERRNWFIKYVVKNNRGAKPQHTAFYPGADSVKSGWKVITNAAAEHNDPGVFTTFNAFEWSSAPGGGNLHRNIIFRDASVPEIPMGASDIMYEEGLWSWLSAQEEQGARSIAIPHNSNASKGRMFPAEDHSGNSLDIEYAKLRGHFERAIEIMQVKGNSEVTRKFWAADEFSDFENAPSIAKFSGRVQRKENYVRYGVVQGMALEQQVGANPFKLGFVGGTDSHNGLMADVDEDNFVGGHGGEDATPQRRQTAEVGGWIAAWEQSAGSITGVWAVSNTREAIWDAIHDREVYATSGPRIAVRFFGGWKYQSSILERADVIQKAYDGGVPMGGDLRKDGNEAPKFVILANKDALGANLDRIQVVKGWVDSDGNTHDKVFDVAWAGERQPQADGKLPAVGNTVDLATATYRNTIGSSELATVWQDPEFDPSQRALYYTRVLEIPTPRWTTFDSVRAGLPLLADVATTVQERAWSSPIWYQP
ncbi:MAG: DUF3604 domain-containing protein [Halioglobus sp.]